MQLWSIRAPSETAETFWGGQRSYLADAGLVKLSRDPPAQRLSLLYLMTCNS